jgi:hypothetical protein
VHSRLVVCHAPTGATRTTDVLDVFESEDGKIRELVEFVDAAMIADMMSGAFENRGASQRSKPASSNERCAKPARQLICSRQARNAREQDVGLIGCSRCVVDARRCKAGVSLLLQYGAASFSAA